MVVSPTRHGLRLCQHGVVISELRTTPGPTHSVFDILAALIVGACSRRFVGDRGSGRGPTRAASVPVAPGTVARRVAVLGFAGGGMMAPLRALGHEDVFEACDLDRPAYELFRLHCPQWGRQVRWHHGEAGAWLERQTEGFDIVVEDLSVPVDGDVVKPPLCWGILPRLIRRKLRRRGIAIFNLLPPGPTWGRRTGEFERLAALFPSSRLVTLEEYENRILVAGTWLPSAVELGRTLRELLRRMRSRQRDRVRVQTVGDSFLHGSPGRLCL